jgi:hypothetical protein
VLVGPGTGSISLSLVDDDSIQDYGGNSLGGAGKGNGDYTSSAIHLVNRRNATMNWDLY